MRLITFIAVGAAVGLGLNYLSKKSDSGRSIIDDIADKAPDWFDQAKHLVTSTAEQLRNRV
jgi:hypothetical protein